MLGGFGPPFGCVPVLLVPFEQGFDLVEDRSLLQWREALELALDPGGQAVSVDPSILGCRFVGWSLDRIEEIIQRNAESPGEHGELGRRGCPGAVLVIGDEALGNSSGLGQLDLCPASLQPLGLDA